tara:strand:- start:442 stop:660 length:219 start_codon:yes stop_codon:yes gene_type:complete
LLKVKGHNNLYRDPSTNSIVNKDSSEYEQYVSRRHMKTTENEKVVTMEEDLANLKSEISEIKSLLKELVSNG